MTIDTIQQAGPDKLLRLSIPVDEAGATYRVVVVVEPEGNGHKDDDKDGQGWPLGYWENVAGSVRDENFVRPPQGEIDRRLELE